MGENAKSKNANAKRYVLACYIEYFAPVICPLCKHNNNSLQKHNAAHQFTSTRRHLNQTILCERQFIKFILNNEAKLLARKFDP